MSDTTKYVGFSISEYDHDGDPVNEGVFLHIGDNLRLTFDDLAELKRFHEQVGSCIREIEENYPNEGVLKR